MNFSHIISKNYYIHVLSKIDMEGVIRGVLAKIPICFGLRHCHASAIVGNTVRQQVECSVELFRQQMEFSEASDAGYFA